MRTILLLLLGLLAPICASAVEEPTLTAGPAKFEPQGYQVRSFTLTNTLGRPIYYDGYSPDFPIRSVEVQSDMNPARSQLENDSGEWCGMGLAERRLAPHRSVVISAPVPSGKAWRIGIAYSLIPSQVNRTFTVWSPKLTIPSPNGQKDDASKLVRLGSAINVKNKFPYTFSITNVSAQTLYYGGYRDAPPLYINAYRHWFAWTDDGTCDWCGTGLGFQGLKAGQTRSFTIPAQNNAAWRIGLTLYRTQMPTTYADMYETVWWPEQPGNLSK